MPNRTETSFRTDAAADLSGELATAVAVESWENEGGHFPSFASVSITPSDVSTPVSDQTANSRELAAMRARFLVDFAGGTMGRHHNTYQHRARVLRRLESEPPR